MLTQQALAEPGITPAAASRPSAPAWDVVGTRRKKPRKHRNETGQSNADPEPLAARVHGVDPSDPIDLEIEADK